MKKKLEAELISIAHRILKLKNKSELIQLHQETQKLYEKLSVLRFVEENFSDLKPTIGQSEIREKIEAFFEEELAVSSSPAEVSVSLDENAISRTNAVPDEISEIDENLEASNSDNKLEQEIEEEPIIADESSFKPAFELAFETGEVDEEKKNLPQISFNDLLGSDYVDPVFVKPEDLAKEKETVVPSDVIPIGRNVVDTSQVIKMRKDTEYKPISLNDRLSKGITIGLNDRIAFMKNLFLDSSEDYNRVLSQLMTFATYAEAEDFINNFVKPDYNYWVGKEEYSERFMEIIEKRFS